MAGGSIDKILVIWEETIFNWSMKGDLQWSIHCANVAVIDVRQYSRKELLHLVFSKQIRRNRKRNTERYVHVP